MSLADRLRARAFGTLVGVRTTEPVAALTFDDGPDPETTPRLLDLLARHGAKATFFLVGKRAAKHPGLVARLAAEGHAIGNHSWDHPALSRLPAAAVAEQLRRAAAAIGDAPAAADAPALRRPEPREPPRGAPARLDGGRLEPWSAPTGRTTTVPPSRRGCSPGCIRGRSCSCTIRSRASPRSAYRDRGAMLAAVEALLVARPDWRFVTVPALLTRGRPRRRYWIQATDPGYLAGLRFHPDLAA